MNSTAPKLVRVVPMSSHEMDRQEALHDEQPELPLEEIQPRPHASTRDLNPQHVKALAESIRALGLLEPLVVDRFGRLVAGAHRLAALRSLAVSGDWPTSVPVRVLVKLDAASDARGALLVELAENEKRKDYSPSEVRALADRLRSAGFRDRGGRPRRGEKPLMPALEVAIGKSRRRIYQLLENRQGKPKTVQNCTVLLRRLQRAVRGTTQALKGTRKPEARQLLRTLQSLDPLIGKALVALSSVDAAKSRVSVRPLRRTT